MGDNDQNLTLEEILSKIAYLHARHGIKQEAVEKIAGIITEELGREVRRIEIGKPDPKTESEISHYKKLYAETFMKSRQQFASDVLTTFKDKGLKSTVGLGLTHYLKDIVDRLPQKGKVKITSKRQDIIKAGEGGSIAYEYGTNADGTYTVTCSGNLQDLVLCAANDKEKLDQGIVPSFLTKDAQFLNWGVETITIEYDGTRRQIPLVTTSTSYIPYTLDHEIRAAVSETQFPLQKNLDKATVTCEALDSAYSYTLTIPEGAHYLEIVDQNSSMDSAKPVLGIVHDEGGNADERVLNYTRIAKHENRLICFLNNEGAATTTSPREVSLFFLPAKTPMTESWGYRVFDKDFQEKKAGLLTVNTIKG